MQPLAQNTPYRGNRTRRTVLQAIGVGGVTGLTGCLVSGVGQTPASSGNNDVIVLGGSMSLSGIYGDLGRLYKDAYELTVSRINDAGGVELRDGRTYDLEVVLRDDESDALNSDTIYRELVDEEDVHFLVGPYSSTVTLQASAVASVLERPMVAAGGASPAIFRGHTEWIFSLLPAADTYTAESIDLAMAQSDPPSEAAILAKDDTFSQSTADGARDRLTAEGIDIVVDQTYPREVTDLTTHMELVEMESPDMLIVCAHQRDAVLAAVELADRRLDLDMAMATVGTLTDSFIDEAGSDGDYWFGPSPWAITADYEDDVFGSVNEFVSAIEAAFGYHPNYHSAAASGVIQTFQRAFMQADELSAETVRDTIRDIEFESLYGPIQFDEDGLISKDLVVYQWLPDVGNVLVWPGDLAEADPIYPVPTWDDR